MQEKIICPQCHSEHLSANSKGFNNNQAAAGMLVGGVGMGIGLGMAGSGTIQITCLKCGNQFFPGAGAIKTINESGDASISYQQLPKQDKSRTIAIILAVGLVLLAVTLAFFRWLETPH